MSGSGIGNERQRETTRRAASGDSIFLPPLAGTSNEKARVVIRNDVYEEALESARRVLRLYHSERRRQL